MIGWKYDKRRKECRESRFYMHKLKYRKPVSLTAARTRKKVQQRLLEYRNSKSKSLGGEK